MPTYPIQLKRNGTAAATPSSLLHGEVALNYADGKLFWKDASNVIRSFTFQAYATSSHTHAASDITSGTLDAARLPLATTIAAGAVIVGTGLGVSSGTVSVTYGTSAGTACQGNDSRLSDTRTPTDGSVTTAKIANDAVTYAKIQNVSATDRLLGRSSAGSGDVEEIACGSFGRSLIGSADAASARTTLSVQPTASPAFTGTVSAAAANFTGAVSVTSPLAITGTVAGNVRQIKMQTSGVDRWQITPSFDAESGSNAGSNFHITRWSDAGSFMGTPLYITRSTGVVNCESGLTIVSGQLLVTAGSASACGVAFSGDPDTGIAQLSAAGANTLSICTNSAEAVRVNASQNVGIGVSPTHRLDCNGEFRLRGTGASTEAGKLHLYWVSANNRATWTTDASGNAILETGGTSPTGRLWVNENGNVGIGASPGTTLDIQRASADAAVFVQGQTASTGATVQLYSGAGIAYIGTRTNHPLVITTNNTERVRVDASGNVCVNSTGDTNPAGSNVAGACLSPSGYLSVTRNSDNPLLINRKTNDGTLTTYQQDGTTEGSISVAGNTVSYNAFCGSHWAQLIDGSRPAILRGTVLETIDEMCEWPEGKSDRLVRVKISDTPRSRRVYGVFMAWDDEYAATGDLYVTALGAYMVRVSGVVQSGDLLESAGDGTARTQSDDIVRSSTIGKVSSTHRVAEYDDGSYLVPCVLMCG